MNDHYQIMKCYRDTLYIASTGDIDDCVKPKLQDKWQTEKWNMFSSQDKTMVEFEGQYVPYS